MAKTANNISLPDSGSASLRHLQSHLSTNESLITAFFITVLVHSSIIFGITFTIPAPQKSKLSQTLDIVLVKTESEKPPEEPDYLAQADQMGGGNLKEKAKPTSKNPGETPTQGNALQNKPKTAPIPEAQQTPKKSILSTPKPSQIKAPKLVKKKKPKPKKTAKVMTTSLSEIQQKIVDMEAMLDQQTKRYAKSPKATYITASTRRTADAMYLFAWTKKIERIGNLNYPDQARKDKLEGQLTLSVTIAPDGHLINTRIRKSSGHKVLDDAAKRIVELAAPFAALPKEVLQGNNRVVITRTWQFTRNAGRNFSHK